MPFPAILAETALAKGVTSMRFDGMSVMAIFVVLILGYVIGRMWAKPAQIVGLP